MKAEQWSYLAHFASCQAHTPQSTSWLPFLHRKCDFLEDPTPFTPRICSGWTLVKIAWHLRVSVHANCSQKRRYFQPSVSLAANDPPTTNRAGRLPSRHLSPIALYSPSSFHFDLPSAISSSTIAAYLKSANFGHTCSLEVLFASAALTYAMWQLALARLPLICQKWLVCEIGYAYLFHLHRCCWLFEGAISSRGDVSRQWQSFSTFLPRGLVLANLLSNCSFLLVFPQLLKPFQERNLTIKDLS